MRIWLCILCLAELSVFGTVLDTDCRERYINYDQHLGTKSPYRRHPEHFSRYPYFADQCQSERIWLMVRHGTRTPSSKVIHQMKDRLPELRKLIFEGVSRGRGTGLCDEDLEDFHKWEPNLDPMDGKILFPSGEDEMVELAENYQSYFPDLFPGNYSNSSYLFKYTATQRTAASARSFTVGLFGRRMSHHVWFPPAVKKDPVLRFYKLCKYWRENIDDTVEALEERTKFDAGPEMLHTLIAVSEHLNLNFTLSLEDVKLMYVACAFETALYPWKKSPWCTAFSEDDLKVLEFSEDLEYYWIDGHGYNLTYEQACPAIRDMARRIIPGFIRPGTPPTTVYFTHSGALLKILSRLGLYKDDGELRHDHYRLLQSRLWKVSNIDTFGTNLAFVLCKCSHGYHVLTLHQEKPVHIPGCDKHGDLCPLGIFLKTLQDIIYDCSFEKLCFPSSV